MQLLDLIFKSTLSWLPFTLVE